MKKFLKPILSGLILVTTTAAFVWYLKTHPEYLSKLSQTDLRMVALLVVINSLLIVSLSQIYLVTLRLTGHTMGRQENLLLTIYSSIANFFGPLQSGPGVRAVYLNKKQKVRLRDYTFATLIYYAMFALISAFFLLVGTRPWWQTLLAVAAVGGVCFAVFTWFGRTSPGNGFGYLKISPRLLSFLFIFTFLQLSLIAVRYYTELQAVHAPVSVGQAISYSGAANFALFVSVTPDGIGIRESFLLFSQQIHGVTTEYIVSASLVGRASYIFFLALLFLVAVALHAKDKFRLGHTDTYSPKTGSTE